jgi:hypothetical protein
MSLDFETCPDLLDTLVEFMTELYCELFPKTDGNRFYSYRELFEMEHMSNQYFYEDCGTTIDLLKQKQEFLIGIGLILRNASLHVKNQNMMADNIPLLHLAIKTLNVAIPLVFEEWINDRLEIPTTFPVCTTLEHRKNALIMLSSLAHKFKLPDIETTQLIVDVCQDFTSEVDMYYVYPCVDLLSKLMLHPQNLDMMAKCDGIVLLCGNLLKQLPSGGFTYDTTPNQMAQYELSLMVLCNISLAVDELIQKEIVSLPGFLKIIRNCAKRPVPPMHFRPPPELVHQFFAVRERSFRAYLILSKQCGRRQTVDKELIEWMYRSQKEGDQWMVVMIADYLST